ncbi:MAG: hypothetical protein NVS3B7_17490 [Candidatus Elarobacter sp.]
MHEHVAVDPSDPLGIAVVAVGAIATAAAFVLAFRWSLWPGETDPAHPKNTIMREDR